MGEKRVVEALISGGRATAGPPLGPALGPLGLNVLAVVNRINEITKDYAGMKVPVKITVDLETKGFEVSVGVPTTAALVVKELGIEKGSGDPKSAKVGDLSMGQVIRIAKLKREGLLSNTLKGAVKEVVGTCLSMGITVDEKDPRDAQRRVELGEYDELFRE